MSNTMLAASSLAIAIFSLINEIFLRPLPIEEPARVLTIFATDERVGGQNPASHLNWRDLRDQNEVFEAVAGFDFVGVSIKAGEEATIEPALLVSGNYFDTLGVKPFRGRFFLPEEDGAPGAHPVAVVHHGYWSEELGADIVTFQMASLNQTALIELLGREVLPRLRSGSG